MVLLVIQIETSAPEQRIGAAAALIEQKREIAAARSSTPSQWPAHESPRTTKLYDRTQERLTQDEVERIRL